MDAEERLEELRLRFQKEEFERAHFLFHRKISAICDKIAYYPIKGHAHLILNEIDTMLESREQNEKRMEVRGFEDVPVKDVDLTYAKQFIDGLVERGVIDRCLDDLKELSELHARYQFNLEEVLKAWEREGDEWEHLLHFIVDLTITSNTQCFKINDDSVLKWAASSFQEERLSERDAKLAAQWIRALERVGIIEILETNVTNLVDNLLKPVFNMSSSRYAFSQQYSLRTYDSSKLFQAEVGKFANRIEEEKKSCN